MGLMSAGGGDDRLQVGMAIFAIVMSLTVSMLVPIVAPAYDLDTGYSYAEIYTEKANLEAFTGESMMNNTPWRLTAVYTPWNVGDTVNIDPETGWLYGQSINYTKTGYSGTTSLGDTTGIYLDKDKKSAMPLTQTSTPLTFIETDTEWWAHGAIGTALVAFGASLGQIWGVHTSEVEKDVNYWDYTGYRYEFDPMLKIDWSNPNDAGDPDNVVSQTDAKLSLVWFADASGQGLSNGLILYRSSGQGLVYNLYLDQIIEEYNTISGYSSKYPLDFDGVSVYLNIRFDQDVIATSEDLTEAWNDGRWTIAITAKSMDNFMQISSSNSLSNSAANILDTYIKIFTLSMPDVPFLWSMVLWLICILPLDIVVLMFLSRFGILGVGMGILGNVLLGVLGA